jgi:hypothetical protein
MPDVTPVSVHGFNWTAALVGLLNVLFGGALVSYVRSRPRLKEIEQSAEDKLRNDLLTRVEKLEQKIDAERERYEALIAIMRHRLNNADQCIDALLLLLKNSTDPQTQRAVAMIEEMRARQRDAEATEKAAFHAANIARSGAS